MASPLQCDDETWENTLHNRSSYTVLDHLQFHASRDGMWSSTSHSPDPDYATQCIDDELGVPAWHSYSCASRWSQSTPASSKVTSVLPWSSDHQIERPPSPTRVSDVHALPLGAADNGVSATSDASSVRRRKRLTFAPDRVTYYVIGSPSTQLGIPAEPYDEQPAIDSDRDSDDGLDDAALYVLL